MTEEFVNPAFSGDAAAQAVGSQYRPIGMITARVAARCACTLAVGQRPFSALYVAVLGVWPAVGTGGSSLMAKLR